MKNIFKNKKASLVLSTVGVVAVSTLLLATTTIIQPNNNDIHQNLKDNQLKNQTSDQEQNLPQVISENQNKPTKLVNSNFYFSNFQFANPDKGLMVPIDETAIQQWRDIKTNLEKFPQFSSTTSYQFILEKINDLLAWSELLEVRDAIVRVANKLTLWNTIKVTLGWKEFSEVAGSPALVQELTNNINLLSGFVHGSSDKHRIERLIGQPAMSVNLVTGVRTPINIPAPGYNTEIKIAEFSPATIQGNIKINFSFSARPGSGVASEGSLIIRNKDGQLNGKSLSTNKNDLEVFGRWNNLGQRPIDNATNFKSIFDNFVLSKGTNGKVSVIARLNKDQTLTNITVDTKRGTLPIDNFGIIASRIDATPLYDLTDTQNVITDIQFFSNNLNPTRANPTDIKSSNTQINTKYQYYVGSGTTFDLKLFYKDLANQYKELYEFVGDEVSESIQQGIKVGIDTNGIPSNIEPFKIQLSSLVLADIQKSSLTSITNASISLRSTTSENPAMFKQEIYLNNLVTALAIKGSPILGKGGVLIAIDDITEKIFFEKPTSFVEPTTPTITTTESLSSAWVNQESEAIAALATVYDKWAKNDPNIGSDKLGSTVYNKIAYNKVGNTYKDISWKSQSNNYTGSQLYSALVDEYSVYQKINLQLIGIKIGPNIFEVGPGGTTNQIISTQLLEIENKTERANIIQNVKKIIDTTKPLDEKLVGQQLANLIRIKFSEMKNSLMNQPINKFYHSEIKKYLNSEVTDKTKFADVDTFLTFNETEALFNLKNSNILTKQETLTGTQKMESLFDLLYFGKKEYNPAQITYFGNSIFSALSTSGGSESVLDLFTKIFVTNQKELSTFDSQDSQTISNVIKIYDRLFSTFGFGINSITEKSLKTGVPISLKWGNVNLEDAITSIFNKFNATSEQTVNILEKEYKYNTLKSLITSANIYNSLIFRKNNTPSGVNVAKDQLQIANILNAGIISPQVLFTWSRVQKVGNDINLYTTEFSSSVSETKRLSLEIKTDKDILEKWIVDQKSLLDINPIINVQIVWPILVGLIAVGMIVISSLSLAGTRKISKLSSKKVVMTILVVAIVISLASLGVIGIFVVPGLI